MNEERMYKILLGAHISEKATVIAEAANQFAFKVTKDATRPEIKEAVEKIYGVVVQGVSTLNVKGKVKVKDKVTGECECKLKRKCTHYKSCS